MTKSEFQNYLTNMLIASQVLPDGVDVRTGMIYASGPQIHISDFDESGMEFMFRTYDEKLDKDRCIMTVYETKIIKYETAQKMEEESCVEEFA